MAKSVFTSESVTRGHPDKVCDQIADRILDEILRQDPEAHVACEVTVSTDQVHIFGEVTTDAVVEYENTARQEIARIGYTQPGKGSTRRTAGSGSTFISSPRPSPEGFAGAGRRKTE